MHPIWHLRNINTPVLLYQSDDDHYIVTRDGKWSPILSCGLFLVVNHELLSFFQLHLDKMPKSYPVSIYDYELKKHIEGYYRIYISDPIEPETIDTIDDTGCKAWRHGTSGSVFISSDLKAAFEQSGIEGLEVVEGFSEFGQVR